MPTIQSMELPIPKNWQDFETIVRDAQAQRWKSTSLQKNGRPGQRQHGVDIYGPDEIGRPVGIQCKRFKGNLTLDHVATEIGNAEKFKGRISALFIATTNDHDAELQAQVREISDKRAAQGDFAVALLFWDEIVSSLLLNPGVLKAHYPQLQLATSDVVDKDRLIAALELGYYGADLWAYVLLIYGEFGQLAQEDPDQFIAMLRILESRVQQLLTPDDAAPVLASLQEVRSGCMMPKNRKSDWDLVETHAKRVSSRLHSAVSLLPPPESKAIDLGLHLGRIYHFSESIPDAAARRQVEKKIQAVLQQNSDVAIRKVLTQAKKNTTLAHNWAHRVFGFITRELRFGK